MNFTKYNRTKVVCTIGPASNTEEMLRKMIFAGMDVARLNFSHGTHEEHAKVIALIRKLSDELATPVTILQDLQGPKIRVGKLEKAYPVKPGDRVFLCTSIDEQDGNVLPMQYETFAKDVKVGDLILADDGKVALTVISTNGTDKVELEVTHGEAIGSKKGVNLPYTSISMSALSEKDAKDLEFGIKQNVDWVALSFVRTAQEVRDLKRRIKESGSDIKVMSKIEKPEALKNIDEIIAESDGVMVARGDLGVEIPLEQVPMWQKRIVRKCNVMGRPVIVATQMMESMIDNRRPTRAEANDVANAVTDGADAVMLSGETAAGKYPIETIESMEKIIEIVESSMDEIYFRNMEADKASPTFIHDCTIVHGCGLAQQTGATALVGMTASGYTAYQLSKCRPKSSIYIFTHNRRMINMLNLVWGVRVFYYDNDEGTDKTIDDTTDILKLKRLVKRDDIIIHFASMPLRHRLRTNAIKIAVVD
ncbi:MAG TPA: pyruvate kinase [Bacteroidia bacterium]|nr:pyruvate kinase [Bacteroidia bacterium]